MRVTFLFLILFITPPVQANTEQEVVIAILEKSSPLNKSAEQAYQNAMTTLEAVRNGKPIRLAGAEIEAYAKIIDLAIIQLALLVTQECPNVKNIDAQENLKVGITGLYEINKIRYGFTSSIAKAFINNELQKLGHISNVYGEPLAQLESKALMALIHLISAKQNVGLAPNANEFK